MPVPKIEEFLTDPAHKEQRDFMQGVIDARVKEIVAQYAEEKKKKGADKKGGKPGSSGNFFDDLFSSGDDE